MECFDPLPLFDMHEHVCTDVSSYHVHKKNLLVAYNCSDETGQSRSIYQNIVQTIFEEMESDEHNWLLVAMSTKDSTLISAHCCSNDFIAFTGLVFQLHSISTKGYLQL